MKLVDAENYVLQKEGRYDGSLLQGNCNIVMEQVDLEHITTASEEGDDAHFMAVRSGNIINNNYDGHAPHIRLIVRNCEAFSTIISGLRVDLLLESCQVNQVQFQAEDGLEGGVRFSNCGLVPVVLNDEKKPFTIVTQLGTSFINCTIHAPQKNGKYDYKLLTLIDFLLVNGDIKYNHINSRLSKGWHAYHKSQGITLDPAFRDRLMLSTDDS
ncbi:MAG: hypothetical protein IPL46_11770 [Saprospiraceae bacterium]|nr:hypothetical protein [Saprospiraceae bacterium]